MDDNLMFEYLLQQGAMRPEEEQMLRRQDTIDALRKQSMNPLEVKQAGRHVVAPSWTQGLAQLGSVAAVKYGQNKLDKQYDALNARRGNSLRSMRDSMQPKPIPGIAPSPDDGIDDLLIGFGR